MSSHLKPGLIAIACAVEEMNLPLINRVSEAEEKLIQSRGFLIHGVQLPDPFKMNVCGKRLQEFSSIRIV